MSKKSKKFKSHVDVRSGADILGLNELLKDKKTIVLVYADFCGHCTTFKNDIWKHLISRPNRNAGLASIHYDQVENTPFAGKTINGYPTVFVLKKGMKPEEAEEVKDIRNMEMMSSLAEDPEAEDIEAEAEDIEAEEAKNANTEKEAELLNSLSSAKTKTKTKTKTNNPNSLSLNSDSETLRNSATKPNIVSLLNEATGSVTKPVMPNFKNDMLNSQVKTNSNTTDFNPTKLKLKSKDIVGGSLYASLLEASKSHTKQKKYTKKMTKKRTKRRTLKLKKI